ncbi:MAG: DUF1801 domain-containing protein [Bacteroidota bacterium]|nr:DUF1801 domain-containing protein [Bacteroidota bacterium]
MQSKAVSPDDYLAEIPEERKDYFKALRKSILDNLPQGFEEVMSYGMIGYVVPHRIYPAGYHCDPKQPLPFMSIASQKNSINFYHMGLYGNPQLNQWFVDEYAKHTKAKLDMGKGCIRFNKMDQIPYKLIGDLVTKISVQDWIEIFTENRKAI